MSKTEAMPASGPNAEQIRYWNEEGGPKWVEYQDILDRQIEPLGLAAIDRAKVSPGERVLDVGCGCGQTTLEIARRVGSRGEVLGIDLSAPMLERARERARAAGIAQARFLCADAQTHAFEPARHDLLFSRFGVMFFQDPVAAFRNLRGALAPGGRLALLCWREIGQNPWMLEPMMAIAKRVALPPPPAPDAPGPFAFASPERVRGILERAGFREIVLEPHDAEMALAGGADAEQTAEFFLQIGPAARAAREAGVKDLAPLRGAVAEVLLRHRRADGFYLGTATWIVTALGPRETEQ
jgi:SAM-dependent methyltransferase